MNNQFLSTSSWNSLELIHFPTSKGWAYSYTTAYFTCVYRVNYPMP